MCVWSCCGPDASGLACVGVDGSDQPVSQSIDQSMYSLGRDVTRQAGMMDPMDRSKALNQAAKHRMGQAQQHTQEPAAWNRSIWGHPRASIGASLGSSGLAERETWAEEAAPDPRYCHRSARADPKNRSLNKRSSAGGPSVGTLLGLLESQTAHIRFALRLGRNRSI